MISARSASLGRVLGRAASSRTSRRGVAEVSSTRGLLEAVSETTGIPLPSKRKPRPEGTIASVFASLSGESKVDLPERFLDLKRSILSSPERQQAAVAAWGDLIRHLETKTAEIKRKGTQIIPVVEYEEIRDGISSAKAQEIKQVGSVIVRGVVTEAKALEWLESIKEYIALNPHVKGFPADDKAVYEVYWSKAQAEARSHPASLQVQQTLLSLFNKHSTPDDKVSFNAPLSYCDRLRIRRPGDAQFTLGPHCDGGSVERWEDPLYRQSYRAILEGRWREHDAWDIGTRPDANMNMYDGSGACGVFRAMQGWTSLSNTGPGEGTLKVFPAIQESSAYIMLRPFFRAKQSSDAVSRAAYLDASNWELDLDTSEFPNSPLGRSQELDATSHPHLDLDNTMTSIKVVRPGDQAWWHCDGVHSVEDTHAGKNASAVMYIPAVPLTIANIQYIKDQRDSYNARRPPPDFPGGEGESNFQGKSVVQDILSAEGKRAMGLEQFDLATAATQGESSLLKRANAELGF